MMGEAVEGIAEQPLWGMMEAAITGARAKYHQELKEFQRHLSRVGVEVREFEMAAANEVMELARLNGVIKPIDTGESLWSRLVDKYAPDDTVTLEWLPDESAIPKELMPGDDGSNNVGESGLSPEVLAALTGSKQEDQGQVPMPRYAPEKIINASGIASKSGGGNSPVSKRASGGEAGVSPQVADYIGKLENEVKKAGGMIEQLDGNLRAERQANVQLQQVAQQLGGQLDQAIVQAGAIEEAADQQVESVIGQANEALTTQGQAANKKITELAEGQQQAVGVANQLAEANAGAGELINQAGAENAALRQKVIEQGGQLGQAVETINAQGEQLQQVVGAAHQLAQRNAALEAEAGGNSRPGGGPGGPPGGSSGGGQRRERSRGGGGAGGGKVANTAKGAARVAGGVGEQAKWATAAGAYLLGKYVAVPGVKYSAKGAKKGVEYGARAAKEGADWTAEQVGAQAEWIKALADQWADKLAQQAKGGVEGVANNIARGYVQGSMRGVSEIFDLGYVPANYWYSGSGLTISTNPGLGTSETTGGMISFEQQQAGRRADSWEYGHLRDRFAQHFARMNAGIQVGPDGTVSFDPSLMVDHQRYMHNVPDYMNSVVGDERESLFRYVIGQHEELERKFAGNGYDETEMKDVTPPSSPDFTSGPKVRTDVPVWEDEEESIWGQRVTRRQSPDTFYGRKLSD